VLLIWVYANKFDENGFFTNFKARLIARGDLYKTEEETYIICHKRRTLGPREEGKGKRVSYSTI